MSSMTSARIGGSRPGSVRPRRVVQDIVKRRQKPYKTEQQRVIARKRKLDLQTSFASAPRGFTFLPVGTPELADRCKELSRQRSLAVYIVNAKPVSKNAEDPGKVSHHVHRIGYHFRAELLDEAVQELGYVVNRGQFVKESELAEQQKKSLMAQTLAKYNVRMDTPRESPEQVRAAIKELFPKIPEDDLNSIVEHAWACGSSRVGNADLGLARRVQLATSARIRHTYTDYDLLLKAFEWKDARSIVEPHCLRKLIEWRGENEQEDDGELEEMVRETIVIDDDDDGDGDNLPHRRPAGNGNMISGVEDGDTSDDSIEITHQVVADNDFGTESAVDERSRAFMRRFQPLPRNVEMRNDLARQKIGAARQQIRDGVSPPQHQLLRVPQNGFPPSGGSAVNFLPHDDGPHQDEIVVGGRRFRRVPPQQGQDVAGPNPTPYHHSQPVYGIPATRTQNLPYQYEPGARDRPVASIERESGPWRDSGAPVAYQHLPSYLPDHDLRPLTPEYDRAGKRRRVEHDFEMQPHGVARIERVHVLPDGRIAFPVVDRKAVVDLTSSPPRHFANGRPAYEQPMRNEPIDLTSPPTHKVYRSTLRERSPPSDPIPYDPTRPQLGLDVRIRGGPTYHDHRPAQLPAKPEPRSPYLPQPFEQYQRHPPSQPKPPSWQQQVQHAPTPVHNLPAPFYQIRREEPWSGYQATQDQAPRPSYYGNGGPPSQQPAPNNNGAGPTQYYY